NGSERHAREHVRPFAFLLTYRFQDQISDRVGLRYEGNVARLYLDCFRTHALGLEAFEISVDPHRDKSLGLFCLSSASSSSSSDRGEIPSARNPGRRSEAVVSICISST